jgi:L-ribulose-5-phosphate 3-epimerase UlaE
MKQELNSSETSCDRVGGLIGGVVKKASCSMVERGLVKKVSFSSLEMSVVKKSISAWQDWAKKRRNKVQKVVKKLSKSCQTFCQTW